MDYAYWSSAYSDDPNESDYQIIRNYNKMPDAGWTEPPTHVKEAYERIAQREKVAKQKIEKQKSDKSKTQRGGGCHFSQIVGGGHKRCGAIKGDGTACLNRPQKGRGQCHLH